MGEIIARNMLSWLKLLIKLLLLHLVGCLCYCINDARSDKHRSLITCFVRSFYGMFCKYVLELFLLRFLIVGLCFKITNWHLEDTDCEIFVCFWCDSPQWARTSSFTRFLDHIHRRTTLGRTPLDDWSAVRRDLYLTRHNTHKRQTYMTLVGSEPTITAGERPQTYSLDRAATGTGDCGIYFKY